MAINVIRCPRCESTFNSSAQLLKAAAGKVRCGACLAVFQAEEHFLAANQAQDDDDGDSSVFVGNQPHDYFDPAVFLTRHALQEADADRSGTGESVRLEQDVGNEEFTAAVSVGLDQDAGNEEFMAAVSVGLDQDAGSEEFMAAVSVGLDQDAGSEEFTAVSVGLDQDTTAEHGGTPDPAAPASDTDRWPRPDAAMDEAGADATAASDHPDPDAATDWTGSDYPGPDAATDRAGTDVTVASGQSDPDADTVAADPDAGPATGADTTAILSPPADPDPAQPQAGEHQDLPTPGSRRPTGFADNPENMRLSMSFSLDYGRLPGTPQPASQQPRQQPQPTEPAEAELLEIGELEAAAAPELEMSEELAEQDFHESVSAGLDSDDSAIEQALQEPQPRPPAEPAATEATADTGETAITAAADSAGDGASADTEITLAAAGMETGENGEQQSALPSLDAGQAPDEPGPGSESEPDSPQPAEKDQDDKDSTEEIRARALRTPLQDEEGLEAIPRENLAVLDSFRPPVELLAGKPRRLGKALGLSLLILVLAAGLVFQYLWRYQQLYSQLAAYRPFYEFACTWLDCELPVFSDISAIRSDNLDIRSHPEYDNGLLVSLTFRNTARFPQPFPVVILSFNSVANTVVALREFAPEEYLDPALLALELMPVMSPLQVQLELIDPGAGTTNYTLAFREP